MSKSSPLFSLVVCAVFAACGGESAGDGDSPDGGAGPDASPGADARVGGNDGVLPPEVAQSGVAYVAHFNSGELRSFRLDTAQPEAGPTVDIGAVSHDLAIDHVNDRIAVVSDVGRSVALLTLERPSAAGAPIAAPTVVATVPFDNDNIPRFATLHPYRDRLYVLTADPSDSPLVNMDLHAYDISTPSSPTALGGEWPMAVPVTVSFALDPVRDVLFVVGLTTDKVHAFDVGGDRFDALAGEPLDLLAQYPQQNQAGFQARSLTADVRRHRLYAARAQSALSELIVIDYPEDIPTGGARYRDFVTMDDLSFVADGFDVDVELDERPNMLSAYVPAVDPVTGAVLMSSDAWNGNASMAAITAFRPDATLAPGCDEVPGEGFGCFLRDYIGGSPSSYNRTDGALCVDGTAGRALATSIVVGDELAPGAVHVFSFDAQLAMAPVLAASGGNLGTAAYPIGAVCH